MKDQVMTRSLGPLDRHLLFDGLIFLSEFSCIFGCSHLLWSSSVQALALTPTPLQTSILRRFFSPVPPKAPSRSTYSPDRSRAEISRSMVRLLLVCPLSRTFSPRSKTLVITERTRSRTLYPAPTGSSSVFLSCHSSVIPGPLSALRQSEPAAQSQTAKAIIQRSLSTS